MSSKIKAPKRTVVSSRPYIDHDDCLAAAVDDFIRRRKVARWRVTAEWADGDRGNIAIFYSPPPA